MSERLYVENYLDDIQIEEFAGRLEAVIDDLVTLQEFWSKKGYRNLRIRTEQNYDDVEIALYGEALENDQQYLHRMQREQRDAELNRLELERERQEYERLKAKFERK